MNKKLATAFLALIGLLILVGAAFLYLKNFYEKALITSNSENTETVEFQIKTGETLDTIVPNLVSAGLIQEKYKNVFLLYIKLNNLFPTFQAGTFDVPKNLNMKQLVETLQNSEIPSIWVTIPEGLRLDEIATVIETEFSKLSQNNFSKEEFIALCEDPQFITSSEIKLKDIKTLEGFLFPDKYLFPKDSTAEQIITAMIANFNKKVARDYTYDDIILASLIERESVNSEDRRIISDILRKRLEEQWLLQVDATLLYYYKDWKHVITVDDKEVDQPYNTYKNSGLTPTPICNPGIDSINAVFEPQSNPYYYYIHDNNRVPHYASTLEQHEANIQQYLR